MELDVQKTGAIQLHQLKSVGLPSFGTELWRSIFGGFHRFLRELADSKVELYQGLGREIQHLRRGDQEYL